VEPQQTQIFSIRRIGRMDFVNMLLNVTEGFVKDTKYLLDLKYPLEKGDRS